jgi:hypothetical protein
LKILEEDQLEAVESDHATTMRYNIKGVTTKK